MFAKGLAEGLGIARDEVRSPTSTLIQEDRGGRLTMFHVDLYRIDDRCELDDLGLDETAEEGALASSGRKSWRGTLGWRPLGLRLRATRYG